MRRKTNPIVLALFVGFAVAAVAAGVFYGIAGKPGKSAESCSAASIARAKTLAPLATGEVAAIGVNPRALPNLGFKGPDGATLTLADFKGKALLLNLWATWCVPCRAEMPALDKLQAEAGGPGFEVVAVNIDTARLDRPAEFLNEIGVKILKRYADPSSDIFETLRIGGIATGLPTSLLIDKDGCALATIAGPANWASADAVAAVKALAGS